MISHFYCVLLGAGASVDAGVPTSAGLLQRFCQEVSVSSRRELIDVLCDIDTLAPNIEKVALAASEKTPDLYKKLRHFIISKVAVHKSCSYLKALYSLDLDGIFGLLIGGISYWKGIRNRDAVPPVSSTRVFSLNYDTTIEDAIQEEDPYYGLFTWDADLKGYVHHRGLQFNNEDGVFRDPPPLFSQEQPLLKLPFLRNGVHKLHGSVNWVWKDIDGKNCLTLGSTRIASRQPEIIFAEQEKLRLSPPYANLFHAFSESMSKCAALIVIGYSWSDTHINRVVKWEVERGMKLVEVSLFSAGISNDRAFFPDDAILVRGSTRAALLGRRVEVYCGAKGWTSVDGGLVTVVQRFLHKQLFKTDEEWMEYRRRS